MPGRVALVTGASSGIGASIAKVLARNGYRVTLAARRKDRLDQVVAEIHEAGGMARAVELDVADAASATAAVNNTVDDYGGLDVLINNAGVGWIGPTVGGDLGQWRETVSVNLLGTLHMTHAALPYLIDSPMADLVMISSDATRFNGHSATVYMATKRAVEVFANGLRDECAPLGVRVTSVLPGLTHGTELPNLITDTRVRRQVFYLLENTTTLAPEDVAEAVTYAINQPARACVGEIFVQQTQFPKDEMA